MPGMHEMLRQAQVMQKKMTAIQEEMKKRELEVSSGGGMVKVTITGGQEVRGIVIEPSVMEAGDVEMLQDLVLTAVNESIKQSKELMEKEMSKITGGMSIPGMF